MIYLLILMLFISLIYISLNKPFGNINLLELIEYKGIKLELGLMDYYCSEEMCEVDIDRIAEETLYRLDISYMVRTMIYGNLYHGYANDDILMFKFITNESTGYTMLMVDVGEGVKFVDYSDSDEILSSSIYKSL